MDHQPQTVYRTLHHAIMAALQQSVQDEQREQCLIPGISFTCHGFITKWILAAKWANTDHLPELQTWNSTDGITYTKRSREPLQSVLREAVQR